MNKIVHMNVCKMIQVDSVLNTPLQELNECQIHSPPDNRIITRVVLKPSKTSGIDDLLYFPSLWKEDQSEGTYILRPRTMSLNVGLQKPSLNCCIPRKPEILFSGTVSVHIRDRNQL
jgi:hypothetical protein